MAFKESTEAVSPEEWNTMGDLMFPTEENRENGKKGQ